MIILINYLINLTTLLTTNSIHTITLLTQVPYKHSHLDSFLHMNLPSYFVNVIFFLSTNLPTCMPTYPNNLCTLLLEFPFYLLTCLLTQLPTYILTYLPMHPPSYLPQCLPTYLHFLHNQILRTNYLLTSPTSSQSYLSIY